MKYITIFAFSFLYCQVFSQQYDSVKVENKNIDSDNKVYKIGNVYIFDYEIVENNKSYKLNETSRTAFEFVDAKTDTVSLKNIHLIIQPQLDSLRTNENQTEIVYLPIPLLNSVSSTGLIENKDNIWLHPIRDGFFQCLETCPFPYIKFPIKKNQTWTDAMLIGEAWGNEKWGKWEGSLLLKYNYKITGKKTLKTDLGIIKCYIVESFAESSIGNTKLVSYYSKKYGFVRYEYTLLNNIKVNIWLTGYMKNKKFEETLDILDTKKYIKE